MDHSASTSSSEAEELLCNICDKTVSHGSNNSLLQAHFQQHLNNPGKFGQVLYFSSKMPIQETPKSRGGFVAIQAKRNHNISGPSLTRSPKISPRQPQFIHGTSPSPRSKPNKPNMTRSIPRFFSRNSEPIKKPPSMYQIPLKTYQSFPKMYEQEDDECKKLIEKEIENKDENKKESWYHDSEFHVMSKLSNAECPKCGGLGPFLCGMKSSGNIFCLSSCLLPFIPFVSCCIPKPSLRIRIFCTRCKHEMMEFDPKEKWLIVG